MVRLPLAALACCMLIAAASQTYAGTSRIDLAGHRFDPAHGEPPLPAEMRRAAPETEGYGPFIVQSGGPVTATWRCALEAAGAVLYGYVPEHAFLAGMDPATRERIAALPGTAWIGVYHPAYTLSPALAAKVAQPTSGAPLLLRLRVFRDPAIVPPAALAAGLEALGIEILQTTDDGFSRRLLVRAPRESIMALARVTGVRWIEELPAYRLQNTTTRWVLQSNQSGATPLWDRGLRGEGQIVTMMDSGLDYNSCWFRELGELPPGPAHRKVIDYAVIGGGVAYDGCADGHGTHVGGTLCGDQSYLDPGNLDANGLAYAAQMTVQDIGADDEDACYSGSVAPPASLTDAFNASYALGARVHTNSWGSVTHAYTSYSVDVDYAMWAHPDMLICVAAGNSGPLLHSVGAPGTAKNCVTVGACLRAPDQESIAGYSSRGPASTTDDRMKPTLLAPGGGVGNTIISADNDVGNPPVATCQTVRAGFYGTSMATPAVAGLAALVRQYFQSGFYPGGMYGGDAALAPSAALVKAILVASARDTGFPNIPNNNEGWGRILLDDGLFFAGDTRETFVVDETVGMLTGEEDLYEIEFEASVETLAVTLVWTDYPGTEGSGAQLVNDLDLRVTAPDATDYLGNAFSGGLSQSGGSADRLNVEECVRLAAPAGGLYAIRVSGHNVPEGPQPYALAVNGALADFPPLPPATREDDGAAPAPLALRVSAAPTPARGWVTLSYALPDAYAGPVTLDLLDVEGRLLRRLVEKGQRGGAYTASWDGRDAAGRKVGEGIYFARLTAGERQATGKLVLSP